MEGQSDLFNALAMETLKDLSEEQMVQTKELIKHGNIIEATKYANECTKIGLKSAKCAVDYLREELE